MDNVKIAKSILALAKELVAEPTDRAKHLKKLTEFSKTKQKLVPITEIKLRNFSKELEGLEIPQQIRKMTVGQLVEILDRISNKNNPSQKNSNNEGMQNG